MIKVRVIKPWSFDVTEGQVMTFATLHPSLEHHVMVLDEDAELEVATPEPVRRGRPPKQEQE
jgi:hypothetical protein